MMFYMGRVDHLEMEDAAARSSRFEAGSTTTFEQLSKEREARRRAYESRPHSLPLTGLCLEMCPEYERYEREAHLDLSPFEMLAGSEKAAKPGDHPRIDHQRAVKKYHRPAAGNEAPLPEDVRPAPVLLKTMEYLVGLLEREDATKGLDGFAEAQKFVRDRTRSLRQDCTLQNLRTDRQTLHLHHQIARFHILSGHRLSQHPTTHFDAFQNTEQLRKVLQSLSEFYSDLRANGGKNDVCPLEEGEARAYYLLTHLEDPDVFRKGFGWHPSVIQSAPVQFALAAGAAYHQSDYVHYFRLLAPTQPTLTRPFHYLASCLLISHAPALRSRAATTLARAYAPNTRFAPAKLASWLAFQDQAELEAWADAHGFGMDDGGQSVVRAAGSGGRRVGEDGKVIPIKARVNYRLVESLAQGIPLSHLILGSPQTTLPNVVPIEKPMVPIERPVVPIERPIVPVVQKPMVPKPIEPVPMPAPKPAPIPASAPTLSLPTPVLPAGPDTAHFARVMLDALLTTLIPPTCLSLAHETCQRHAEISLLAGELFETLLDDLLDRIAEESCRLVLAEKQREADSLAVDVYERLLDETVDGILQTVSFQVYELEYVERARELARLLPENDPLFRAYEQHSTTAKRKKSHTNSGFPDRSTVRSIPPVKQDVTLITEMVEEERRAASTFHSYLRSLLQ